MIYVLEYRGDVVVNTRGPTFLERVESWLNWISTPELRYNCVIRCVMDCLRFRQRINSWINWVSDDCKKIDTNLQKHFKMKSPQYREQINSLVNSVIDRFGEMDPELQYQRNTVTISGIPFSYIHSDSLLSLIRREFLLLIQRRQRKHFWNSFSDILQMFDENKCRDLLCISKVFQLALMFSSFYFHCENRYVKLSSGNKQLHMNFVARLMIYPYRSERSQDVLQYDTIQWAILSGKYELLREMLKYGIMYVALCDNVTTWMNCCSRIRTILSREHELWILPKHVMLSNFLSLNAESRQRMLAVSRAIEVSLELKYFESRLRRFSVPRADYPNMKLPSVIKLCFRIAFETIPEPFITSQEIKKFLTYCFSVPSYYFLVVIRNYEQLFPESLEPRTPRSLMHLSRCQVRQNLRQVGQFPHGIADLKIPHRMQDYIVHVDNNYVYCS